MVADPGSVIAELSGALARWLDGRRGGHRRRRTLRSAEIVSLDVVDRGVPALVQVRVALGYDGAPELHHAVLAVGTEAPAAVRLADVVGALRGDAVVWDALADPSALDRLVPTIAPGIPRVAWRRREHQAGYTTVATDGPWNAVFFHRVVDGRHPEVLMSEALGAAGFGAVPAGHSVWTVSGRDVAVVRSGGEPGRDAHGLAVASLSAVLDGRTPPHRSTLDLAGAMARLGSTVAEMHLASSVSRGSAPLGGPELARSLEFRLAGCGEDSPERTRLAAVVRRLREASDLGCTIAPHGDLDLRRIHRSGDAWSIADAGRIDRITEPEPASPLADVADVLVAIDEVAATVVDSRGTHHSPVEDRLLADSWAARLSESFVGGYGSVDGIGDLLPPDPPASDALVAVFELVGRVEGRLGRTPVVDARPIPPVAVDRLAPPLVTTATRR